MNPRGEVSARTFAAQAEWDQRLQAELLVNGCGPEDQADLIDLAAGAMLPNRPPPPVGQQHPPYPIEQVRIYQAARRYQQRPERERAPNFRIESVDGGCGAGYAPECFDEPHWGLLSGEASHEGNY